MALTHSGSDLYLILPSAVMEPDRVRTDHHGRVFQWPRIQMKAGEVTQPHSTKAKGVSIGSCPESPGKMRVNRDWVGPERSMEGPVSREMGMMFLEGSGKHLQNPQKRTEHLKANRKTCS